MNSTLKEKSCSPVGGESAVQCEAAVDSLRRLPLLAAERKVTRREPGSEVTVRRSVEPTQNTFQGDTGFPRGREE